MLIRLNSLAKLAVYFFFVAGASANALVVLRGDVRDTVGATVRGAHILVRTDRSGSLTNSNTARNLISDSTGQFETTVAPGFYDVCVMADAFDPQCRKVLVSPTSNNQHFRLQVNPQVEKRIGDIFQ